MFRRPPRSTLDLASAASDVYKRQPYLDGAARWREDNRDRRLARDRERDAERLERARAFSREAQSAAVEREERVAETAARCEAERFAEYQRQVRDARAIRAVQSAAQEVGNSEFRESGPGSATGRPGGGPPGLAPECGGPAAGGAGGAIGVGLTMTPLAF